jgi:hypothetical protein
MGIHGNSTAVMVYEDAQGWLVGAGERRAQGHVRDDERGPPGHGPAGAGDRLGRLPGAAEFARERLQGRSLSGRKNPEGPADPIIVHPDVRRMLLESRAFVEGGRAFVLWTALQADLQKSPDEATATKAKDFMALLTPVLKAYLTDKGFHVASQAMQVHGGSGYTEHFPASQYLRDARITMIYEGANGVQALDLVGRKLAANGGRAVMSWFAELDAYIAELEADPALATYAEGLKASKAQLQEATFWLMQNGLQNPENAGAASTDYLHLFGLAALAYMWAQMARRPRPRSPQARATASTRPSS